MIDFASSLYLGLRHPSSSLAGWDSLTSGAPSALVEPEGSAALTKQLAFLIGGASAVLLPSTLHLFIDLLGAASNGAALFYDEALYPVAKWGVELAVARGATATVFPHMGKSVDARWLQQRTPPGRRPVIVTDGFCTGCGTEAPLARYVEATRRGRGLVVVDDTQALGLFGSRRTRNELFGRGGGGSLRRQSLAGAPVLVGASLAKAFGVPLAVLVGPAPLMARFIDRSHTRVHTSGPCATTLQACRSALAEASRSGGWRRQRLASNIGVLRGGLSRLRLSPRGELFPVQSVGASQFGAEGALVHVHERLRERGVNTVVTQAACRSERSLTFLLRADHTPGEIDDALRALAGAMRAIKRAA